MQRKASCSCGQLSILVKGEPNVVVACNCLECQKTTGSVFGVSSYFDDDQVLEKTGASSTFERYSEAGRRLKSHFCSSCGSTVYWKAEVLENQTGIAVGCFADPEFPEPKLVAWNASRHGWVGFPGHCMSSVTQDFEAP